MKKDKIFVYVFVGLFIIYVVMDMLAPKPINWMVTFKPGDKNPFGGFILNERSADLFQNGLGLSNNTIAELAENETNMLILAERADVDRTDLDKLFEVVSDGGNVLIAANSFADEFKDTLEFESHFEFQLLNQDILEAPETTITLFDSLEYTYPASLVSNYFELGDSSSWNVVASKEEGPVAITKRVEMGTITLVSVPYIFTNFGLLINDNYQASASLLSVLPEDQVHYTMFYQSGRGEPQTPLRYFLSEDALRWSLYLGLFLILSFLMISSRRKQRAIPVILPPTNATVEYVKTLGSLFFRERDHRNAAMKLINHFLSQIKERYYVKVEYTEKFYDIFSSKSNVDREHVIKTFELIQYVKSESQIGQQVLIDLSRKIEIFK